MGLIPATAKKSWKVRILHASLFAVLTLGAISMLLPFFLMLAGATRTGVDQHAFDVWPAFLRDDNALFRKYIEALFNESPAALRAAWRVDDADFRQLRLPETPDPDRVAAWERFLESQPDAHNSGFSAMPVSRGRPLLVRGFKHHLKSTLSTDIHKVNQTLDVDFPDWNAFVVLPPDPRSRLGIVEPSPWQQAWEHYQREIAPVWTRNPIDLTGFFHEAVWIPREGRAAPRPPLTPELPEDPQAAAAWRLFVRDIVHPRFVRMDAAAQPEWQQFLQARHITLDTLSAITGIEVSDWSQLLLPERWADSGPLRRDWEQFLQGWLDPEGKRLQVPETALRVDSPDLRWRAATGTAPPRAEADAARFLAHRREIRRTFLWQHFAAVYEILILDGRGIGNTLFYCAAAVLLALLVNPLAAYALSRFRPRRTYALLLFLLLTMAFPPMVTQIPVFLMLRDFGLLNTFWALLLPGMAHGYSIFLLKGFFDSLPRDLYESAALDGAGEIRMFWMITFSLSKPILAVIALSAFVNAYTNFMFALLIAQDERMWTLMVWLYQLQHQYGRGVMNAAFVLAALPTLVVFLLAQNQIMRGIVIPVEK